MTCAVEDAGFEIRDCLQWLYGSGFPKSHNVALGIDKLSGAPNRGRAIPTASKYQASDIEEKHKLTSNPVPAYESVSEDSLPWKGWGTALKPANEPIVLARKPLIGTVARNVIEHGTGALNIDATRIPHASDSDFRKHADSVAATKAKGGVRDGSWSNSSDLSGANDVPKSGRWPANVILDEDAAEILDWQSGNSHSSIGNPRGTLKKSMFSNSKMTIVGPEYNDYGGASRFFYCSKASKREKGSGCNHPTVKPVDLMRYLIRLVTPIGGIVLDPFLGSGSTGIAAREEGMQFIGIELSEEYAELAESRIANWKYDNQITLGEA
jgi:site-specific DNA-methyltransferase (adenine-specific)